MVKLFEPIEVGGLRLANRIVIAPMCQYSAVDGAMTDWHQMHLGQLALSGAGALTIEATAVSPEGRITNGDVGLYDDRTEAAMRSVLESVRRWSDMPLIIQLAHAGRKASCAKPWQGGTQIAPDAENGWQTVAPSAIPFAPDDNPPVELDKSGLARIREAFAAAARRGHPHLRHPALRVAREGRERLLALRCLGASLGVEDVRVDAERHDLDALGRDAEVGDLGGASAAGPIGKDPEQVAALPPQNQ